MAKKAASAPSKSEIIAQICKDTDLSKKEVSAVFESLNGVIKKSLRGSGAFTMPGLLKMKVVKKPAPSPLSGAPASIVAASSAAAASSSSGLK